MPIYNVQAPDGKVYKVEGPENAKQEDLFGFVQQQLDAEQTHRLQKEYGPGVMGTFGRAAKRGAGALASTVTDVIPAMAASAFGFDKYAKEQMAEAAEKQRQREAESPTIFRSLKDVEGISDIPRFVAETLGEQVPNIATSLIPGMGLGTLATRSAVGAAAKALTAQAAERGLAGAAAEQFVAQGLKAAAPEIVKSTARGQAAGIFLGSYAQNAPEVFQNVYENTGQLAPGATALFGAVAAALDSVLPAKLAKQMSGPAKMSLAEKILEKSGMDKGLLRSVTAGVASALPMEGLTEGAQEAISIAAENFVAKHPQIFGSKEWERVMESAVRGAIAGGAFGGVGGATERMHVLADRRRRYDEVMANRSATQEQRRAAKEALEQAQRAVQEAERAELNRAAMAGEAEETELAGLQQRVYTSAEEKEKAEKAAANRARQEEQQRRAQDKADQDVLKKAIGELTDVPKDLVGLAQAPSPLATTIAQAQQDLQTAAAKRARPPIVTPTAAPPAAAAAQPPAGEAPTESAAGTVPTEVIPEPTVVVAPTLETITKLDDPKALGKLLGVGPTARILRADGPLAGKDISNPEDAAEVKRVLEAYASGKPAAGAAEKIESFLSRPEFQGVAHAAETIEQPSGAGVGVAGESEGKAATEAVTETEPAGVVPAGEATTEPVVGEAAVTPAVAPEVKAAVDLISAIDAGGVPLNTARINTIARDLGLEVKKTAKPEETIERIRAAVARATTETTVTEPPPTTAGETTTKKEPSKSAKERAEEGFTEALTEQAALLEEIDQNVDNILRSRVMNEVERRKGTVTYQDVPAEDQRGTQVHNYLRLAQLVAQYRDNEDALEETRGTLQEEKFATLLQNIRDAAAASGPNVSQAFDQLIALPRDRQGEILSNINREALEEFDRTTNQLLDAIAESKAPEEVAEKAAPLTPAQKNQQRTKQARLRMSNALNEIYQNWLPTQAHKDRFAEAVRAQNFNGAIQFALSSLPDVARANLRSELEFIFGAPLYAPVYQGEAFNEADAQLARDGDLNGLLSSIIKQEKDPAVAQVLRKIRSLNLGTKLVIGNPVGMFALPIDESSLANPDAPLTSTSALMREGTPNTLAMKLSVEDIEALNYGRTYGPDNSLAAIFLRLGKDPLVPKPMRLILNQLADISTREFRGTGPDMLIEDIELDTGPAEYLPHSRIMALKPTEATYQDLVRGYITHRVIEAVDKSSKAGDSFKTALFNEIDNIHSQLVHFAELSKGKELGLQGHAALDNVGNFIEAAMTDPAFLETLAKIPGRALSEEKEVYKMANSLLGRFLKWVRDVIFGRKEKPTPWQTEHPDLIGSWETSVAEELLTILGALVEPDTVIFHTSSHVNLGTRKNPLRRISEKEMREAGGMGDQWFDAGMYAAGFTGSESVFELSTLRSAYQQGMTHTLRTKISDRLIFNESERLNLEAAFIKKETPVVVGDRRFRAEFSGTINVARHMLGNIASAVSKLANSANGPLQTTANQNKVANINDIAESAGYIYRSLKYKYDDYARVADLIHLGAANYLYRGRKSFADKVIDIANKKLTESGSPLRFYLTEINSILLAGKLPEYSNEKQFIDDAAALVYQAEHELADATTKLAFKSIFEEGAPFIPYIKNAIARDEKLKQTTAPIFMMRVPNIAKFLSWPTLLTDQSEYTQSVLEAHNLMPISNLRHDPLVVDLPQVGTVDLRRTWPDWSPARTGEGLYHAIAAAFQMRHVLEEAAKFGSPIQQYLMDTSLGSEYTDYWAGESTFKDFIFDKFLEHPITKFKYWGALTYDPKGSVVAKGRASDYLASIGLAGGRHYDNHLSHLEASGKPMHNAAVLYDPARQASTIGKLYGEGQAGSYDPVIDTVTLDPTHGMNRHTFVHEVVHAAIAHVLANPNLQLTKDFLKFFSQIKDRMGPAYGGRTLQEFAAELVSNPEFQALLKTIRTPRSESMFRYIMRRIAEFFGFAPKTTAFDTGMKFVNDAIDISKDVEPIASDKMFFGTGDFAAVGQIGQSMPALVGSTVEKTKNYISNLKGRDLKSLAFGLLRLDNIYDLYKKELPSIKLLLDALEKRNGMQEQMIKAVNDNYRKFRKIEKKYRPQMQRMSDIAIEARLKEVDILNPKFQPSELKKADYFRLKTQFAALPAEVQGVYRTIRKEYDSAFNQSMKILEDAAASVSPSLTTKLREMFALKKPVLSYVPFLRSGDFRISYVDPDTKEPAVHQFESIRERQLFADTMLKGIPYKMYQKIEDARFSGEGLPPSSFVLQLMEGMRRNNATQEQINSVYQTYLETFPAESIMKQFMKAKGVAGMERDIVRGYGDVMIRWARKLANSEYVPKIDRALHQITQEAESQPDPSVHAAAQNIEEQAAFFHNPNFGTLVSTGATVSYAEFILGNISSALVNLTSLPMLVYPILTGKFGWGDATTAMTAAGKTAMNDWSRSTRYKKLHAALMDHAQLEHTMAREVLEGRRQKTSDYLGIKARVMDLLSVPFSVSEKYNRGVTAIAAYDLALKSGMSEEKAIDYAVQTVKTAHTSGIAATGPRWMQTPLGRMFFTFKSFLWNSAYVIARAFHQAAKGESKEIRNAARRQLVATYGMAAVFAGAKGMPFYGLASVLAQMIAALFGDDEEPFDFDEFMREALGELFYKGFANYITNLEIANRAGVATDLIFRDDPRGIAEHGYVLSAMQQAFGPAGSVAVNAGNAVKMMNEGHVIRGLELVAPSFIRNVSKGARYMLEGATTLNGDPVMEDIGAYNSLMQMVGFSPADLSSQYERVQAAKGYQKEVEAQRTRILQLYDMGRTAGDSDLLADAAELRERFNSAHPKFRIGEDTIQRSIRARKAAEKDMIHGVRFNKKLRGEIEEKFFAEYED